MSEKRLEIRKRTCLFCLRFRSPHALFSREKFNALNLSGDPDAVSVFIDSHNLTGSLTVTETILISS